MNGSRQGHRAISRHVICRYAVDIPRTINVNGTAFRIGKFQAGTNGLRIAQFTREEIRKRRHKVGMSKGFLRHMAIISY